MRLQSKKATWVCIKINRRSIFFSVTLRFFPIPRRTKGAKTTFVAENCRVKVCFLFRRRHSKQREAAQK